MAQDRRHGSAPDAEDVHLVVPTRAERPELLEVCIGSLIQQTFPIRVTLVAPAAAASDLRARYADAARLRVVAEKQSGLSAAINQAWRDDDWSSTFTGWLGDDDALPPDSVRHAVQALRARPEAVMVHGRCLVINEDAQPVRVLRNGRPAAWLAGYGVNLIAQPGCLFRTAVVRQVNGLDEALKYAMDVDLYARLRLLGPVISTPHQVGVFREHVGSLSTSGKADAAAEARAAQRRALRGPIPRLGDLAAIPATRVMGRLTSFVPPSCTNYWRPNA